MKHKMKHPELYKMMSKVDKFTYRMYLKHDQLFNMTDNCNRVKKYTLLFFATVIFEFAFTIDKLNKLFSK